MRISTTIFGILSLMLGGVCIYAGIGGYLNLRAVLVGSLLILAVTIGAAAFVPQKSRKEDTFAAIPTKMDLFGETKESPNEQAKEARE